MCEPQVESPTYRSSGIGSIARAQDLPATGPQPRRFLVLVDASPSSRVALQRALEWKSPADSVVAVHAIRSEVSEAALMAEPGYTALPEAEALHKAHKLLADLAAEYKAQGLKTQLLLGSASGPDQIVEYAKANNIDTIFTGDRGLSSIGRFFLGSFSQAVISKAECTVVVAKAQLGADEGKREA